MNPNKIREEAWDTIYSVITTNVADPEHRSHFRWVVSSFPDTSNSDFPEYPIIVISEPITNWDYKSFHREKRYNEIQFNISIFSRSNLEMSQLADAIDFALRDNIQDFANEDMLNMKIQDYPQHILQDGKRKIHYKQFTVRFAYYGS